MKLWSRAPAVFRKKMFCWLVLIGLTLSVLVLSDLLNWQPETILQKTVSPRRLQRVPDPLNLNIFVQHEDPALELSFDSAPLKSLQEDQLLYVSPRQGTKSPQHGKRTYKVLRSGSVRNITKPPTHGGIEKSARPRVGSIQKEKQQASMQKQNFNEMVSEKISLHRNLPEARHPGCLGEQYSESLPSASVVICFHDQASSTLLRTVHSVLNTVPKPYVHEILLVDDLSQQGHLKAALSEYVSHLDGVHLIRSTRRIGVGGCRTLGAAKATGEVLVFMDSGCECQQGWLEPLLERVVQDRTRVVSPIMDLIDWQTFQYTATQWPVRGVFDWRLDFHWQSNADLEDKTSEMAVQPVQSPALGGEVMAIDKHFFQTVGAYDPGMLLWEVEQVELSIRVWLCGGSMEVVPCSRVANLIHHHMPNKFPDYDLIERNKIRVADAWMDSYRKIFYRRDTFAHFIRQSENPNITERLCLKRSLGCRNFNWFLSTVYPQLYIPQDRPSLSGELYNMGTDSCADHPSGLQGGPMSIAPCTGTGGQHCDLNSEGEVRLGAMGGLCLDVKGDRVVSTPCPAHLPTTNRLKWKFIKLSGQIVHQQSQMCVEAVNEPELQQNSPKMIDKNPSKGSLYLRRCLHHPRQQWHFEQLVAPKGA